MERLLVTNKDIQILTNRSEKACYRLMQKIRAKSGKDPKIPLTIHEFSDYMRIRPDIVDAMLKKKQSIRLGLRPFFYWQY